MIALVAIISKRMIALMATSYWKTLKTLQKPGRKTCLKLLVGTCLNLAKLLFGVVIKIWRIFFSRMCEKNIHL
jgi:hypothetical protein